MPWSKQLRNIMLAPITAIALIGCGGDTTGPSALGEWEFNASYGGNGYSCTISRAILRLDREAARWTGSLSGGELFCVVPPGESAVPPVALSAVLDSIQLRDNSVSFKLLGEPFRVTGQVAEDGMSGTVEAATPFCQCTEPFLTGTWTASRLDFSSARARR